MFVGWYGGGKNESETVAIVIPQPGHGKGHVWEMLSVLPLRTCKPLSTVFKRWVCADLKLDCGKNELSLYAILSFTVYVLCMAHCTRALLIQVIQSVGRGGLKENRIAHSSQPDSSFHSLTCTGTFTQSTYCKFFFKMLLNK